MQTAVVITQEERIIAKARKGLRMVAEGEDKTMEGWLIYGAALNEGRAMFPRGDNARFHEWKVASLGNLPEAKEEQAAMWAAANPEEFKATKKAHPRVRTVRGLHAKFKSPDTPEAINDSTIKKVKALYTKATDGSPLRNLRLAARTIGQQYLSAGLYLKEAKQRVLKTRGMTFEKFLKDHCPIGRSRAYEVIAIADGTKTVEEVREATNERKKKHREEAPVRSGTDNRPEKPNENNERPVQDRANARARDVRRSTMPRLRMPSVRSPRPTCCVVSCPLQNGRWWPGSWRI